MKLNKQAKITIIALLCMFFIALRLWNLTANCLWFDEIFSVHAATHDWTNLFWFVAQDLIHPPLFYIFFKIWIQIGGESLFWLRFFSVFFSILSLAPFLLICRELKLNFSAIALSILFFAVNGCLIKYSQEVRMYALFQCVALFSMWLFIRYFNFGKDFWILTIVNILLIYTHYFGWLFILSQILTILIFQNIKIRQMMIMLGLLLLSFSPWVFTIWEATKINANFGQNLGWINKPDFFTLFQFIFDLSEPFFYQQTTIDPPSIYWITIPILLIFIMAFVFYFVSNWRNEAEEEKRKFYLLFILFGAPILFGLIASWALPYSIWGTRHLIIVFSPLYFLTAISFSKIQLKSIKIIGIILVNVLIGLAFFTQINRPSTSFILCSFQELSSQLPQTIEKQNIYVFEDDAAYHLWFALRNLKQNYQIIKVRNVAGIQEDKAYFLPRGFDEVKTVDENQMKGEHFWIAFRDVNLNKSRPPLQNLLSQGYKIGEPKTIEAQGLTAILLEVNK